MGENSSPIEIDGRVCKENFLISSNSFNNESVNPG